MFDKIYCFDNHLGPTLIRTVCHASLNTKNGKVCVMEIFEPQLAAHRMEWSSVVSAPGPRLEHGDERVRSGEACVAVQGRGRLKLTATAYNSSSLIPLSHALLLQASSRNRP